MENSLLKKLFFLEIYLLELLQEFSGILIKSRNATLDATL